MTEWESPKAVSIPDIGFMDARSKLIDLAAFLDRVQRAGQEGDFRVVELRKAIALLAGEEPSRAKRVLLAFSDPTTEPIPKATMQGATGAYKG